MWTAYTSVLVTLAICCAAHAVPAASKESTSPSPQSLAASAMAYATDEGVTQNQRKAAALYCKAARSGDIDAMFTLGLMYANGAGIVRDNAAASALFARAAELGHAHAAEILVIIGEEPKVLPGCMTASNSAAEEEEMDEPDLADGSKDSISDALRDALADLSSNKRRVAELVRRVAPSYEIDPRLALALIAVESNFEPLARSVKNARGVMQLTPGTAARFNVEDPWNVQDNVRGGLTYLRWLLAYYEGQVALVMAAYNAGEGAVDKYRGIPPYPETRAYVRRVQRLFGGEQHPYDPGLVLPSPILAHSNAAR